MKHQILSKFMPPDANFHEESLDISIISNKYRNAQILHCILTTKAITLVTNPIWNLLESL